MGRDLGGTLHGWIALLRAVNVGGRNPVPMAKLRTLCEELGCSSVRTYIQSGNVIFTCPDGDRDALSSQLAGVIEEAFGVTTPVVLRSFAELRSLAAAHPFGDETSNTHVAFLTAAPARNAIANLEGVELGADRFVVSGRDVFLHYPNGVHGSKLTSALLERHLGVAGTVRNWRTVTKLVELASAGD